MHTQQSVETPYEETDQNSYPNYYTVGIFDLDGLFRGKRIDPMKFESAMQDGFGFCDVVFGWDIQDKLYDNTVFTGWHTGYPDIKVKLDPRTKRKIPYEPHSSLMIGQAMGPAEGVCPRNVLQRVIKKAQALGLNFKVAFEYEFFVFQETPESIRQKGFRKLTPLTPGAFGYSILRGGSHQAFHQALWNLCEDMGFPLEGLHTETGPGVLEAALKPSDPLEAADRAALFKTYSKILAQHHGYLATFMARWSLDVPGQSGHIHISCFDDQNRPLFFDESKGLSNEFTHFVAGCLQHMPEYTALFAPTINSYTRLVPGFWAPTQSLWGIENRTTAIRAIPGKPESTRVEFRASGADANPYLALAGILAAGITGYQKKATPSNPVQGSGYGVKATPKTQLPRHLLEAAQHLKESELMRTFLGESFVEHFVQTREWEFRQATTHINDWQLERYFEAI